MVPGVRAQEIADKARPVGSENLSPGALGTWRAHTNVWKVHTYLCLHHTNEKKVVDEGWETALILEGEQFIDVDLIPQMTSTGMWKLKTNSISCPQPLWNGETRWMTSHTIILMGHNGIFSWLVSTRR